MTRHDQTSPAAGSQFGLACAATFAVAMLAGIASPAQAQSCDPVEGTLPVTCGFIWDDTNHNGIQDVGEPGIEGVKVSFVDVNNDVVETYTDGSGSYQILSLTDGTYTVFVETSTVGTGTIATLANTGSNDAIDSDGVDDTAGRSTVTGVMVQAGSTVDVDFGFFTPTLQQPGTGTPGYWKNHADAWPVQSITIGGRTYSKTVAISWLGKVGKDKTTTIFASLVSAKLNVTIGNSDSCIATTIAAADTWMAAHPVGSNVAASSSAWYYAEPLHQQMDAYNNGLLCAPHRN